MAKNWTLNRNMLLYILYICVCVRACARTGKNMMELDAVINSFFFLLQIWKWESLKKKNI